MVFVAKLKNVKIVDLSNNKFKSLKESQFRQNKKLKKISLQHNSISKFPDEVFGRCESLGKLSVYDLYYSLRSMYYNAYVIIQPLSTVETILSKLFNRSFLKIVII